MKQVSTVKFQAFINFNPPYTLLIIRLHNDKNILRKFYVHVCVCVCPIVWQIDSVAAPLDYPGMDNSSFYTMYLVELIVYSDQL